MTDTKFAKAPADTHDNISALIQTAASDTMITWSDQKKDEFVKTFDNRVKVSNYILARTADMILHYAEKTQFISRKHTAALEADGTLARLKSGGGGYGRYCHNSVVGGRNTNELDAIADERAKSVLTQLPVLKEAVKIIDPETAKNIDRKDELEKKGKALKETLDEVTEPIVMSEMDPNMTLKQFLAYVKGMDARRKKLLEEIAEVSKEGQQLGVKIAKKLYSGLPGLSEAVVDLVKQYADRVVALDAMTRRVAEQVKFGDSTAALDLLRRFEADEMTLSTDVKAQFKAALDKLKLVGAKKVKVTKKLI